MLVIQQQSGMERSAESSSWSTTSSPRPVVIGDMVVAEDSDSDSEDDRVFRLLSRNMQLPNEPAHRVVLPRRGVPAAPRGTRGPSRAPRARAVPAAPPRCSNAPRALSALSSRTRGVPRIRCSTSRLPSRVTHAVPRITICRGSGPHHPPVHVPAKLKGALVSLPWEPLTVAERAVLDGALDLMEECDIHAWMNKYGVTGSDDALSFI